VRQTNKKAAENNYSLEVLDTRGLTPSDEERFLTDIRIIPSQIRGRVKSGGGRTLPISNKVRLNLSIPILIFYEGSKPVDVYPKDLAGVRYDLSSAFKSPGATRALSVEDCITTILLSRPDLVESKLEFVDTEFGTGSGVADLIFKDSSGLYMLVEAKEIADQETVGQILKQSNGMKSKLGVRRTRNAIVALRTSGNVADACKAADVELYLIEVKKQA
jgi:RecB family endonuclease NucS